MAPVVTINNAKELLASDNLIQLSYVYSYRNKRYWRFTKPLRVQLSTGDLIEIEEGFYTDLSSSPKWLWSIFPPFGDFLLAALIHDFLYVKGIGTRKEADWEMFYWSTLLNRNDTDNRLRYLAVRWFGGSWWRRAARRREKEAQSLVNT